MRLLILGGTSEASALARRLAGRPDLDAELSLAGRTLEPIASPLRVRSGGFGGVEGLVAYLRARRVEAVVDATHPFAAQMSRHAAEACRITGVPLLAFSRPAWEPRPGDRWTEVADAREAAGALGETRACVFLTVGRLSLPAFTAAPQHRYVVRSIDPPPGLERLPDHHLVLARGPFDLAAEERLMRQEGVQVLVTKNSGGAATAPKLEAARRLGVRVVMIRRPPATGTETLCDIEAVMAWIEAHRPPP